MTVYRDGCKSFQVLTSTKKDEKEIKKERPELIGTTIKQATPHGTAFITLNVEKENRLIPYEAFINIGKGRGDIGAISEGIGRVLSMSLKHGVPLKDFIEQLEDIPGETQTGFGENKIRSLPDAIAKGLKEAYLRLNENNEEIVGTSKKILEIKGEKSGNFCPDCGGALVYMEGCQKCVCGYSKC